MGWGFVHRRQRAFGDGAGKLGFEPFDAGFQFPDQPALFGHEAAQLFERVIVERGAGFQFFEASLIVRHGGFRFAVRARGCHTRGIMAC